IHAAQEALAQAGLTPEGPEPSRLAVVVGTALGGIDDAERALAGQGGVRALLGSHYDGPTWNLARWLGAEGPVLTVSTACASGATSLGVAADLLRAGRAGVALAGGGDVLRPLVPLRFHVLRSPTRDDVPAVRPRRRARLR